MVDRAARQSGRVRRSVSIGAVAALGIGAVLTWANHPLPADDARYYSTVAPPEDYDGPEPTGLALADARGAGPLPASVPEPASPEPAAPPSADPIAPPEAATRPEPVDPVAQALRAVDECRAKFAGVRDYTCTFLKRERIGGRLTPQHVMQMKARTRPRSIYFKFVRPNTGREAIWVAGRNGGHVLAHDVGIGKLVAGTLDLDPRGSRAMEDNRHPITEAGIGHLIETISTRWRAEMRSGETQVTLHPNAQVNKRPCLMIESTHPRKQPNYLFHSVKLYIDREHGLPVRFEAYDWPRRPGARPELVEEYTYLNLRLNVGVSESDFDPGNPSYAFGRF